MNTAKKFLIIGHFDGLEAMLVRVNAPTEAAAETAAKSYWATQDSCDEDEQLELYIDIIIEESEVHTLDASA